MEGGPVCLASPLASEYVVGFLALGVFFFRERFYGWA